jgi:hypothetical protein
MYDQEEERIEKDWKYDILKGTKKVEEYYQ